MVGLKMMRLLSKPSDEREKCVICERQKEEVKQKR